MKLKFLKIGVTILSLLSTSCAFADVYGQFGYSRLNLDFEKDNVKWDVGANAISGTVGYEFNDYISFESSVYAPMGTLNGNTYNDNYLESDSSGVYSSKTKSYNDTMDVKYMGTVALKFSYPFSEYFGVFADFGYSVGSFESSIWRKSNGTTEDALPDFSRVNEPYFDGFNCQVLGVDSSCAEGALLNFENKDTLRGFTYGGGIAFTFVNNTDIRLGYRTSDFGDGYTVNQFNADFRFYF